MRTFLIIWISQLVSTMGSYMTSFAITIWAWELTGQATALALVVFFIQASSVLITPFAGVIVDRWNRKFLMLVGDTVTGLATIAILLLYLTDNLQIWHLYAAGFLKGASERIQQLAYTASISMMMPKQQYFRASGMMSILDYGPVIFAPALTGVFYHIIGLSGILLIDITTFTIAIGTLLFVQIPQSTVTATKRLNLANFWREISFGFRYIFARPSLLLLLVSTSLFWFAHDLSASVYSPMILARTNNNTEVLGSVTSAAGVGGVLGAVLLSIWGGSKRRIHGFLLGMVGVGLGKTLIGLGQAPLIWMPAQFFTGLNFPLMSSSEMAILQAKAKPEVQGRVFAVSSLSTGGTSLLAYAIAGPLADYVLEPAMMPQGSLAPVFSGIFGSGPGAGMALLYVISSICLLILGLGGYAFRPLRDVEIIVPDHDAADSS